MSRSPTAAASSAASSASSSSRPTSTSGWPGSASHASFEPKPARRAVMQTAPGMCASSNCSSVRTSTTSAPSAVRLLDLARRERVRVDGLAHERPAVERDDVLEVRRLRAERRGRRARRTRPRRRSAAAPGARARSRSSTTTLRSMPGPAAQRAAEVAGPDLGRVGQREELARCSERKMSRAPSSLSTARSGRAMSPTNSVSPVSTAHGSSLRAVSISANAVCSGRWPGRVQRAHVQRAELELPAVVERLVVVLGRGVAVDVDRRAGRRDEPAVAGDVVGVVVGLEDVLDPHAEVARERAGTRRCRAAGRRPPRRRRPRRRRGSWRSRGRRG